MNKYEGEGKFDLTGFFEKKNRLLKAVKMKGGGSEFFHFMLFRIYYVIRVNFVKNVERQFFFTEIFSPADFTFMKFNISFPYVCNCNLCFSLLR